MKKDLAIVYQRAYQEASVKERVIAAKNNAVKAGKKAAYAVGRTIKTVGKTLLSVLGNKEVQQLILGAAEMYTILFPSERTSPEYAKMKRNVAEIDRERAAQNEAARLRSAEQALLAYMKTDMWHPEEKANLIQLWHDSPRAEKNKILQDVLLKIEYHKLGNDVNWKKKNFKESPALKSTVDENRKWALKGFDDAVKEVRDDHEEEGQDSEEMLAPGDVSMWRKIVMNWPDSMLGWSNGKSNAYEAGKKFAEQKIRDNED